MNDQPLDQAGPHPLPPAYPGYAYRYPGNRQSRWPRYWQFLKKFWWVPVLTLAAALTAAAAYDTLQPASYVSFARMWVSGKLHLQETTYYSEELQFFFGTQVELLQSEKIRQGAANRVQTMNPGLTACPVKIQANQAPKSAMFLLRATGDDKAYTQAYLDATIDEYLTYKKQVRATSSDDTLASLSEQVFAHEKELKTEQEKLSKYQEQNNLAVLQDQGTAAGSYLARLNAQLSDLKLERQFLEAMAIGLSTTTTGTNTLSTPATAILTTAMGGTVSAASPDLTGAKQQLQLLKLQRDELSPYLRPQHPKMQHLEEDIARSEKLLGLYQQQSRDQVRDQIQPARQALQLKMDAVQDQTREWEGKLLDANHRIAEFDRFKANVQRVQSLYDRLLNLLQTVDVNKSLDQEIVSVMQRASVARPAKESPVTLLAKASVGGLALGLAIIVLMARFDDRITSLTELTNSFDEEIVGQVPDVPKKGRKSKLKLIELEDERPMFAESYRNIRSSVLFMPSQGIRPKLLLVTSAVPNEGKSTVSANLARTMAFGGGRVLLIDADLHKGKLHEYFEVERGNGLSELLREKGRLEDFTMPTSLSNLSLITAGELIADASEYFLSPQFEQILSAAREKFDHVIVDSAPVFAADDAPTMAPRMDGVLFVMRSTYTKVSVARQALDILYQRQAKVLGLIFNRANSRPNSYYYYKYADYYHRGSKNRKQRGKGKDEAVPA